MAVEKQIDPDCAKSGDQKDKEGMVKVRNLKTVIPAGQYILGKEVKCTVRTGLLSTKHLW